MAPLSRDVLGCTGSVRNYRLVELPGIEPDSLPGLLPLSCRFVAFRPDSVPFVTCGSFSSLEGVKSEHYRRELPVNNAERWCRPAVDNAVPRVSGVDNSSDFYDDLALCAPLLDVGQGFGDRLEWKDPVYNGTNGTGIDERAELA